jgi:HAD superfamily hydrolase (TIGR01509 family)
MLRGIIFDMDGVIVDSHAAHRTAWRLFLSSIGRPHVPESELDFILDGRKRIDILQHFLGELEMRELEELGRQKDCIYRQIQLEVSPLPGVIRLVRELHQAGILLALATSASRSRAQSTLAELGLLGCFKTVVTGEDVSQGKPCPAIYSFARDRLKVDSTHLLGVEDAVSGIRAAVGAGLACMGVAFHDAPQKLIGAGAIHVVRDFTDVTLGYLETVLCKGSVAGVKGTIGTFSS